MKSIFVGVALVAALNSLLFGYLIDGTLIFNFLRFLLAFVGGWWVARAGSKLAYAALVGVLVFTVDHVAMKGGVFLIRSWSTVDRDESAQYLAAFYGVLISFLMLVPIATLVAWLGGFIAQKRLRGR